MDFGRFKPLKTSGKHCPSAVDSRFGVISSIQGRSKDAMNMAKNFDIVVTTYSTLASDFQKGRNQGGMPFPPLGSIRWHRIVLDEAHIVKNPTAAHTKAVVALESDRRYGA